MIDLGHWQEYCRWRDEIEAVMDQRFYSIHWLDSEIWADRARVWMTDKAAIVAQLKVYPAGGREVHGLVAVGALNDVLRLIPAAEQWGRELGCCVAGISSRSGWQKVLGEAGYYPHQIELRKEL